MSKKKKNPFEQNKYEIFYNIINAMLAGSLILLGAFVSGNITKESILFALVASMVVVVTKFKEYWDGEKGEFSTHMFNFIKI